MKSRKVSVQKRKIWQKPGFWVIALVVLLAAGGGAWYWGILSIPGLPISPVVQAATKTGPDYNLTAVQRGDIKLDASGSGTLVASQSVDLSFASRGTVSLLNVKLGDTVKTGDVLAKLDSAPSLEATVANDQYQLLQAQQTLTNLQNTSNASVALAQAYQAMVKAQDTYNTALNTNQRMAYARCSQQVNTQNMVALEKAKANLDKMTQYNYGSDQWIAAQSAYDTALANYNYCIGYTATEKTDAQASLNAAQSSLQQATQTYNNLKASSGIDPNQLALDEAKVKQAQTQLAQAQSDLQGITLTAPISGKVVYLAAQQGSLVDTSKFVTIADVSHPIVQVSVDETDQSKLVPGSTVQIVFDALPEQPVTGKIDLVNPQLVTSGQNHVAQATVTLDASAIPDTQTLPLGANATVDVIEKQATNTLLIPLQALRNLGTATNPQYAVFVAGPNNQLSLKLVQVGLMDATHAQILSGLNQGEMVSTGTAQVK